jgi:hypothetical protein
MKPLLAEIGNELGNTLKAPAKNVADSEPQSGLTRSKFLSQVGQERLGRLPPDSVPVPARLLHDRDISG